MTAETSHLPPASGNRREGRELGRKGARTRQRLMEAAAAVLETRSPVELTPTMIARKAGTSPATFYVYFEDVTDVVRALAEDANDDLDDVLATLDEWFAHGDAEAGAARFVDTFHAHWNRYRTILSIRNMEADRGNVPFRQMRRRAGGRIIEALARILLAAHGRAGGYDKMTALSRATVMFAAIERLAAAATLYPKSERGSPGPKDLRKAQIAILCELMRPRDVPAASDPAEKRREPPRR